VRDEHVRAHAGLVRCGACRGIFDAREHLIEGTLASVDGGDQDIAQSPQTIMAGVPPVKHAPVVDESRDQNKRPVSAADSLRVAPEDAPRAASAPIENVSAGATHWATAIRNVDAYAPNQTEAAQPVVAPSASGNESGRFKWRRPNRSLTPWQRVTYGFVSLLALIALIAQSGYWFRDEIASRVPATVPALTALCQPLNCKVGPPKRANDLGFVGADLAADPAHKGLLVFNATLRNTGARATAFPSLVLTLDGVGGEPLSRRVFTPEQYAPANANLQRGLDGGAEMEIKLYLDASPATPVGFKVDHAYL
jgi:Protein of unknown function (DUF3426)